jgi:hypothetical protein
MSLTSNAVLFRKCFSCRLWKSQWESPGKASLHYLQQPSCPLRTSNFRTLSIYVDIAYSVVRVQLLKTIVNFTLKQAKILYDFKLPKITEVDAGMFLPNPHVYWRIKKVKFDLGCQIIIAKPKPSIFPVFKFTNFCTSPKAGVL